MVRELAQLYPAALKMKTAGGNTPLHCAAIDSDSVEVVRELAHLYPAALERKNSNGDTPLHLAVEFSNSVEIVRELVSLGPAALLKMNRQRETPLAVVTSHDGTSEEHGKLQVLLEAAPQAAGIACSTEHDRLPLHLFLHTREAEYLLPHPPRRGGQVSHAIHRQLLVMQIIATTSTCLVNNGT